MTCVKWGGHWTCHIKWYVDDHDDDDVAGDDDDDDYDINTDVDWTIKSLLIWLKILLYSYGFYGHFTIHSTHIYTQHHIYIFNIYSIQFYFKSGSWINLENYKILLLLFFFM